MNVLSLKHRLRTAVAALIDEAEIAHAEEVGLAVRRQSHGWKVIVSGTGKWQEWHVGDIAGKEAAPGPSATEPSTTPGALAIQASDDDLRQAQESATQEVLDARRPGRKSRERL
jgi:hypothetical protein